MNCTDARHRILSIDRAALARGDRDLAEHLVGCASCAGAVEVIVSGTDRLRAALDARRASAPVVRRRRAIPIVAGMAVAAGLTFLVVLPPHDDVGARSQPIVAPTGVDAAPHALRPTSQPGVTRAASSVRPTVDRTRGSDSASSVLPVDSELSQVRVIVTGKQSAAVITTSNPKITVVLLSGGESR